MTVELSIAMLSMVAIVALCLTGFSGALLYLRCTDAAGQAARLAARGEQHRVVAILDNLVPGARVELHFNGDLVTAEVSSPVPLLSSLIVRARSSALIEPDVVPP